MPRHSLLGTVIAGGRSTRMGQCKAGLPHARGGTFLDHALGQLSVCCEHVACSVAADGSVVLPEWATGVHTLVDSVPDRGPVEGVCRAVDLAKTLGCAGVLVTPVDLPSLDAEHLQQLIDALALSSLAPSSCRAVVAISDDAAATKSLQPLVAIYPVAWQRDLERLARSTRRSLYRFLEGVDCLLVELPALVLHNVNSPHDLPS